MIENKNTEIERKQHVINCVNYLIEYIKTEMPEKGKFRTHIYCYDDPVSNNEGRIVIAPDSLDVENSRRLSVSVGICNSNYQVETYMKKGSNSEILEYLQQDGTVDELLERLIELDKEAQDKKGEYPFG